MAGYRVNFAFLKDFLFLFADVWLVEEQNSTYLCDQATEFQLQVVSI